MLYFVSVYYSWTSEHPLYAFATKDEALEFMRHDYDNEYIQATSPDNKLIARGSISDSYAIFQFYSGEYIEWFVTNLSNELPLVPNCLEVKLPTGMLVANKVTDPNYPGIDIEFVPDNEPEIPLSRPRVLVEQPVADEQLHTLIWSDPAKEDYTEKITFC